jgi:hypothetical protein
VGFEIRVQRVHALLEVVAVIDVLAVTEDRSFGFFASCFAMPFEFGLTVDLHLGFAIRLALRANADVALALAAGLALATALG